LVTCAKKKSGNPESRVELKIQEKKGFFFHRFAVTAIHNSEQPQAMGRVAFGTLARARAGRA
jgi:hypothetical protein